MVWPALPLDWPALGGNNTRRADPVTTVLAITPGPLFTILALPADALPPGLHWRLGSLMFRKCCAMRPTPHVSRPRVITLDMKKMPGQSHTAVTLQDRRPRGFYWRPQV